MLFLRTGTVIQGISAIELNSIINLIAHSGNCTASILSDAETNVPLGIVIYPNFIGVGTVYVHPIQKRVPMFVTGTVTSLDAKYTCAVKLDFGDGEEIYRTV